MGTLRQSLRQTGSGLQDIERARRDLNGLPLLLPILMKVTDASAISGYDKRWLYTVVEATIGTTSSYIPTTSVNTGAYSALSVSELTNGSSSSSGTYSYGVPKTDLLGTFTGKQIPVDTYVLCVPYWRSDSSRIYLIINTQAISGACP